MNEDLMFKWRQFKLQDQESIELGVEIEEGGGSSTQSKFLLVGSVITRRKVNIQALGRTMENIWQPMKSVTFRKLNDNIILFEFDSSKDCDRVLGGRPWSFDKSLVALQPYDGSTRPSDLLFNKSLFWIRVLDLPWKMMNKQIGEKIGSTLSDCLEVDDSSNGGAYGSWLRIRVIIDITKPLRRGIYLKLRSNSQSQWFQFKYEWLPNFCYCCGLLGHMKDDCEGEDNGTEVTEFYGDWLRAESKNLVPARLQNNKRIEGSNRQEIGSENLGCKNTGELILEEDLTMVDTSAARFELVFNAEDGRSKERVIDSDKEYSSGQVVSNSVSSPIKVSKGTPKKRKVQRSSFTTRSTQGTRQELGKGQKRNLEDFIVGQQEGFIEKGSLQ